MKFALALILTLPAFGAPMLSSNPLAHNKLYLDADTVPWTASDETIQQVWRLVSDAYKPFNVDVTTIDPGRGAFGTHMNAAQHGGRRWGN